MRNFLSLCFLFISISIFGQVQLSDLPDIAKVYKITIDKKKLNFNDTVVKVRLISRYLDEKSNGSVDTLINKGVYLDSAGVVDAIIKGIINTNQMVANITYQLIRRSSFSVGLDNYNNAYRNITNKSIYDYTWESYGKYYTGDWKLSVINSNTGESINSHSLTIDSNAKAKGTSGTIIYLGRMDINSQNNIQLVNYFAKGQVNIFHNISQNTFISTDGRFLLIKQ